MASYQALLMHAIATRPKTHPVWRYNDKVSARALAHLAGVPHPETYAQADDLDDLDPPDVPAVLKPAHGCSSRGVQLLIPNGDGTYTDPRTGCSRTWGEIQHRARRSLTPHGTVPVQPPWLLEELVTDTDGTPACDWRMYTFGGKVEVTLQTRADRNRWQSKWWDNQWREVGLIRPNRTMTYTPTLPPPHHPDDLLDAAARIHARVEAPFVRIDLYDHPTKGPMFGEITPHPGNPHKTPPFNPEWDERLGRAWEAAL